MMGLTGLLALVLTLAPQGEADMTDAVRAALEKLRTVGGGTLTLAPGDYHFRSPVKRNWYVSNHDNELPRNVFLPLEGLRHVTIESSRAEFIFHGDGIAIGLFDSTDVKLKGIAVDYSRPFNTEWRFVGLENGMPILETDPEKFPFSTEGGVLRNAGECYHGEERLAVVFGGNDYEHTYSDWLSGKCVQLSDRRVKMLSNISRWRCLVRPEAAPTIFVMRCARRPNPAVFVAGSTRPTLEDVIVRSSPGMGIICQLSTDVTIRGSGTAEDRTAGAMPRAGSGRVTSLQADATHFSNCRGLVSVENCMFERMCDDAINVHSTCLKIERILPPNRLICKFVHRQAKGFEVFAAGDTVRFIKARTMEAKAEVRLTAAKLMDSETYELTLQCPVPSGYAAGDTIESATWQPEVRFVGNKVNRNISRATLFTTPLKVSCESNCFEVISGAAIKLSGDSMNWFESGGCREVVIRGNRFVNSCTTYCAGVIAIDPEIAEPAAQVERYHRNILIEDNLFDMHGVPLLWARSVSGLVWRNNRIVRNDRYRSLRRKPFHFEYFDNVTIDGKDVRNCPDATVEPVHTYMLLISGKEEVARAENEIIDLTDASGFPFFLGNAAGRLEAALWDGRWEVCLLDEDEATPELLKTIAARAPQLKVVIQLRKTDPDQWKGYQTIPVGSATGLAQAKIWEKHLNLRDRP